MWFRILRKCSFYFDCFRFFILIKLNGLFQRRGGGGYICNIDVKYKSLLFYFRRSFLQKTQWICAIILQTSMVLWASRKSYQIYILTFVLNMTGIQLCCYLWKCYLVNQCGLIVDIRLQFTFWQLYSYCLFFKFSWLVIY